MYPAAKTNQFALMNQNQNNSGSGPMQPQNAKVGFDTKNSKGQIGTTKGGLDAKGAGSGKCKGVHGGFNNMNKGNAKGGVFGGKGGSTSTDGGNFVFDRTGNRSVGDSNSNSFNTNSAYAKG